jgi:hypothetical protein
MVVQVPESLAWVKICRTSYVNWRSTKIKSNRVAAKKTKMKSPSMLRRNLSRGA